MLDICKKQTYLLFTNAISFLDDTEKVLGVKVSRSII